MKALPVAVLAGVLGVGMLVAIPDTAAAQREVPLAAENRMHPDSAAAPLHEPAMKCLVRALREVRPRRRA